MVRELSSRENPLIKYARSLKRRKYREQEGKYLVEGMRLLEDAVRAGVTLETVFFTRKFRERKRGEVLLRECRRRGAACCQVTEPLLALLADTETPQGVVAIARIPTWDETQLLSEGGLFLVVDRVQDPGNLGTMLRTAEGAGCRVAYLGRGTVDPYSSKVLRASMGAVFRLPLQLVENLPEFLCRLQEKGVQVVAADVGADTFYWEADLTLPGALVVGNEAWGIDPQVLRLADTRVKIPLKEGVDSLNAAVAAGVILYEWVRQRGICL